MPLRPGCKQGSVIDGISRSLGYQPAGPAGHGAGITPLDQPLLGAEGTGAAIHHEALAVSLLVVDP